jgi:GDP-L-fucose synthase
MVFMFNLKGVSMSKKFFSLFLVLIVTFAGAEISRSSDFADNKHAKIYLAGHDGLVGSAIMRRLQDEGYSNIVTCGLHELNLLDQAATKKFFQEEKPEYVFVAAAKVGGIVANNSSPAQFLYENLMIEANVMHAAHDVGVKKLLFLGSSCIYPKLCPQPIKEEYLLTSELERTNEGYAIAKIAGLKMCEYYRKQYGDRFISCMPTNLYGPGDNFHLKNSHVLPAFIRRMHDAKINGDKEVAVWGTGNPYREFLYVDDLADALVHLMKYYEEAGHVNVGTGKDLTIKELAALVKEVVGYKGNIVFDTRKPDGTPKKLLNVDKLHALGWKHNVELRDGIKKTYKWFLDHQETFRK